MRIAIIGAGYVGLVSGACFAECGHRVVCVDKNPARIDALGRGRVPIYEPGLDSLITASHKAGRLTFTTDVPSAITGAEAIFIAVGTPPHPRDGRADLSFVHAVAREIAGALTGFALIVLKSTVPVGTSDTVEAIVREIRPGADFAVVANPEFLREGAAIEDFMHPTRVVVGVDDPRAAALMAAIYRPLQLASDALLFTDRRSAELIKYASNAFLATKITFINEVADLCEKAGADVMDVARGMGLDPRIGSRFLNPGPGIGGSCFPKDAVALAETARSHGVTLRIIDAVTEANESRKAAMAAKVIEALGGSARRKCVAVLGLTFKPNTDDMREAPALVIIPALQRAGAAVRAYDPQGMPQARRLLPGITFADDPYECVRGAAALVVVTEWEEFRRLDLDRVRSLLAHPQVIDLRNIFQPRAMAARGFLYRSIGRADVGPTGGSHAAHEHQDENDQQNNAQATRRIVAPAARIGP